MELSQLRGADLHVCPFPLIPGQ